MLSRPTGVSLVPEPSLAISHLAAPAKDSPKYYHSLTSSKIIEAV